MILSMAIWNSVLDTMFFIGITFFHPVYYVYGNVQLAGRLWMWNDCLVFSVNSMLVPDAIDERRAGYQHDWTREVLHISCPRLFCLQSDPLVIAVLIFTCPVCNFSSLYIGVCIGAKFRYFLFLRASSRYRAVSLLS